MRGEIVKRRRRRDPRKKGRWRVSKKKSRSE